MESINLSPTPTPSPCFASPESGGVSTTLLGFLLETGACVFTHESGIC